jgi:hypothetical protein
MESNNTVVDTNNALAGVMKSNNGDETELNGNIFGSIITSSSTVSDGGIAAHFIASAKTTQAKTTNYNHRCL